ncbi:hypothetical protein [Pseudactinotalea sp. HY158]|uniref:hypothetical protein n=1 Tax=Pseudactinotalea sp. HY158 TaxID=2654547 RepID=UPI00129CF20E|nr:hypothetical protein [Pseudactinotalea sp. HY158]QGH70466.1 hypothetical protein GCE65_13920 [Pseudactinotalea sp. HY158]
MSTRHSNDDRPRSAIVEWLADGRRMIGVAAVLLVVSALINVFSVNVPLLFVGDDSSFRITNILDVIAGGFLRPAGIACLVVGLLRLK